MAAIEIKRTHSLELAKAKKKVQKVADHIAKKFDVSCDWSGNTLNFNRSGVDGHIKVNAKSVHVFAELGFFLSALKSPIEHEIERYLDEEFG
jgi:putative polyhydroxyalkanoate system protein